MTTRRDRILKRWRDAHAELREQYRAANGPSGAGLRAALARDMHELSEMIARFATPRIRGEQEGAGELFEAATPDTYPDPDMPPFLRRWHPKRNAA